MREIWAILINSEIAEQVMDIDCNKPSILVQTLTAIW